MRCARAWIIECHDEAKGNTEDNNDNEEILRLFFYLMFINNSECQSTEHTTVVSDIVKA
jgi:hypothetical protein